MTQYDHVDENDNSISIWEKNLIDQRLDFIKQYPEQLIPIEDFIAELDDKNDM